MTRALAPIAVTNAKIVWFENPLYPTNAQNAKKNSVTQNMVYSFCLVWHSSKPKQPLWGLSLWALVGTVTSFI